MYLLRILHYQFTWTGRQKILLTPANNIEMEKDNAILIPGQRIRPPGNNEIVLQLLTELYGLKSSSITELNAYDDRNYHVICEESHTNPHITILNKHGYVLKIVNSLDSQKKHVIDAQNEMLIFLNEQSISCPLPVKTIHGLYHTLVKLNVDGCTESYAVKLLVYRPGELLSRMPITGELLRHVGNFTAKLSNVLMTFSHPAYNDHKTLWMLSSVPELRQFTFAVKSAAERELAHQVILAFEEDVLQVTSQLEQGMIHGDLNEQNLVISSNGREIAAVIDFGDSHRTCLIFDLAITLCYMILQTGDVAMGKHVVEGYQNVKRLTDLEKKILKVTVCARICQSLVMGAYSHLYDPQNEYLLNTQKSGWTLLKKLWPLPKDEVLRNWGLMN
ncbi:Aminoglycoside phosphotransferase domain-containing protein 1 [Eufriesea mexicana]|uniref:Hydroxylysine kinase n=1 Tax=Eufriesea mexicana TaxID=516756 RepID=A0A310SBX3_9HYME|nr:PREDICTED: hydroxylysine kinase [Eufriesea mexicana]OAD54585.1 Aminoglycoside phosphotransferase domain-containing protein 1 [Eufriesea mexicana]